TVIGHGASESIEPGVAEVRLRGGELGGRHVRDVRPRAEPLAEKLPDLAFGLRVRALTEVREPDPAGTVDQIVRGPVRVAVRVPRRIAVVERDRVADAEPPHRRAD